MLGACAQPEESNTDMKEQSQTGFVTASVDEAPFGIMPDGQEINV